jgi:diketogulonate reductase-like aldo/keto reductase
METTAERDNLRYTKMPFTNGSGVIPALGFGTLIPDPIDTKKAITVALEAGFRQFDSAERTKREQKRSFGPLTNDDR